MDPWTLVVAQEPLEHRLARWPDPPSSYQGVAGRLGHGRRSTPDQIIAGRAIAFAGGNRERSCASDQGDGAQIGINKRYDLNRAAGSP